MHIHMKSTKLQTLGADHAIEHLTLHETLDKLMAKTLHMYIDLIAQWITLYISLLNSIVRKKEVMHCRCTREIGTPYFGDPTTLYR